MIEFFTQAGWAPLLIFLARLADVSLQTFRIILISRGQRGAAALIGFGESMLWLVAITQVLRHLDHPLNYVAYAGGFAGGTWLGVTLEGKIALGLVAVRIITTEDATLLTDELRRQDFGVTSIGARGLQGRVRLIFTIVHRKDTARLLEVVHEIQPKAFISVTDVRAVEEGYLSSSRFGRGGLWGLLGKRK